MAYILGFILALRDVALAAHDLVTRRLRRRYTYEAVIKAPKETVRSLVAGADVTFAKANLRCLDEPLPGVENAVVTRTFVAGKPVSAIAGLRIEDSEDNWRWRYLPEYSENPLLLGTDDLVGVSLEGLPGGSTRLRLSRELTHRRSATRITAPLGLRTQAWLAKTEAEAREGTGPGGLSRWVAQAAWFLAALASFWWLAGWKDAAILSVLIVLHELGHALAMWMTGRGVRFIALIPFIGGMAAPRRRYESDAQMAFVALMGPGLSLLPAIGLIWYAYSADSQLAVHAAVLVAIINGINLLPLTPLDGGVVMSALMRAIHRRLALAVAWLGTSAGMVAAFYFQSVLLAIVFVFADLQLIQQVSLDLDSQRKPLRWFQVPMLLAALALTCGAYAEAIVHGVKLESGFERLVPDAKASGADAG